MAPPANSNKYTKKKSYPSISNTLLDRLPFTGTVTRSIAGILPDLMQAWGALLLTDHLAFLPTIHSWSLSLFLSERKNLPVPVCPSLLFPHERGLPSNAPSSRGPTLSMCWLFQPLSAKIPSSTAHFLSQLHNQATERVCGLWKQRH